MSKATGHLLVPRLIELHAFVDLRNTAAINTASIRQAIKIFILQCDLKRNVLVHPKLQWVPRSRESGEHTIWLTGLEINVDIWRGTLD